MALIGFMGAGKSAVAEILSARTGKALIEVDAIIEEKAGKSIPQIFAEEGEIAFREREIQAVKDILPLRDKVVACGGGLVLNRINIDRLKEDCVVVWLEVSPGEARRRTLEVAGSRPLLKATDGTEELRRMMDYRRPFYGRAADIKINTTRRSLESVAERVLSELKNDADFCW
jgi:shikimate kinase